MEVKTHQDSGSPITQSIDAVKSLLAYVGRGSDPMPTFLEMPNRRCILVLSNKKDAYYTVTPMACSCPSATYRSGKPCKHQRKYFAEVAREGSDNPRRQNMAEVLEEHDRNLSRMPKSYQRMVKAAREEAGEDHDSIRPEGKWPGGFNGPVDPEMTKAESPKSSILREMLIDCGHDTTVRDAAYWQKKQGLEA
ncbi:MAG: hypothetical protein WA137_01870 [Methanothrix sp.]